MIIDQNFLIAVMSSSVLSAGLTSYINYLLSKNLYKNEYYKKLLDKRITAYENINKQLTPLKLMVHYDDSNIIVPQILTFGKDYIGDYMAQLAMLLDEGLWVSEELNDEILNLNVLLLEIFGLENISDFLSNKKGIELISIKYSDKIRSIRKNIEKVIAKDLSSLYNLPLFLKSLNVQKTKTHTQRLFHLKKR